VHCDVAVAATEAGLQATDTDETVGDVDCEEATVTDVAPEMAAF
jgi:hypothetical protein